MKATVEAPSNIAFIKYWGKADSALRLPLNSSISMNLSGAYTRTTVDFSTQYDKDEVQLLGGSFSNKEIVRVTDCLDRIRQKTGIDTHAKVVTQNTFPKGAGAAASASGFAALTVAGFKAAGANLSERDLTVVARIGSGSACRSIPDGFVLWEKGTTSEESYAYSLFPHTYWDLCDALVIVSSEMKKVSTSDGMETITTSPYLDQRLKAVPARLEQTKKALATKDFSLLGRTIEEDCLDMHHVMQTQTPTLNYWNDKTKDVVEKVQQWRKGGFEVFFTIDAGPNVHILYEKKNERIIKEKLNTLRSIETVIMNNVAKGAHEVQEHLF